MRVLFELWLIITLPPMELIFIDNYQCPGKTNAGHNHLRYQKTTRDAEKRKILHHFTSSTGSFRQAHLYNMQVSELEGGSTRPGGFRPHRLQRHLYPHTYFFCLFKLTQ